MPVRLCVAVVGNHAIDPIKILVQVGLNLLT